MRTLPILFALSLIGIAFAEETKPIPEKGNESAVKPEPTREQVTLIRHWLSHTSEVAIHQMRGASGNAYYLHKDGHKEVVYDKDGKLVKDGINDGSYNFFHPVNEPLKHFNTDILPWIMWGNSKLDPTSLEERLAAYSRSLGQGLGEAQRAPKKNDINVEIEKSELQAVEFFLRVIEEGKVEEIFKILKDPKYAPKEPLKIGKGLTQGLIKAAKSNDFKPVKAE